MDGLPKKNKAHFRMKECGGRQQTAESEDRILRKLNYFMPFRLFHVSFSFLTTLQTYGPMLCKSITTPELIPFTKVTSAINYPVHCQWG
jgi:hypothetical protein